MPIPMRVPIEYAFDVINDPSRKAIQKISLDELHHLAQQHLVRVAHLKPWFQNNRSYQQFRNSIQVPLSFWQRALDEDPSNKTYVKRQMRLTQASGSAPASPATSRPASRSPSPRPRYKRGELAMTAKLGQWTDDELANAPLSVISISPSHDECDDQDVNLPLPACQAINKVCRRYNTARQYMPYKVDKSERDNYNIRVKYK